MPDGWASRKRRVCRARRARRLVVLAGLSRDRRGSVDRRRPVIDTEAIQARLAHSFPALLVRRFFELNPIERGLALGSKLFTTVVPLSILASALFSTSNGLADRMIDGFGLTGTGAEGVRTLFEVPSGQVRSTINVVGVLVLGYSLLSFARVLQRVYEQAWHLPALRSRGLGWGGLWMVTFAVYFSLSTPLQRVLYSHGLRTSATITSLLFGSLLWLATPFILLGRRVPLRVLAPGGVASAILLSLFNLGSRVYLPHSITSQVRRYGLVGVTFTLLTWMFAFSLMLIVAAACGAVLGERRADWADPTTLTPASDAAVAPPDQRDPAVS
jgi:hypothetical protein